jgi:hypothetical protein
MRKNALIMPLGLCVLFSSFSMCWAGDNNMLKSHHVAIVDSLSGQHVERVQVKEWLDNIKPAAGVQSNTMPTTARTPYWKTTVNRRSRR